jgi:hypothetical protein
VAPRNVIFIIVALSMMAHSTMLVSILVPIQVVALRNVILMLLACGCSG